MTTTKKAATRQRATGVRGAAGSPRSPHPNGSARRPCFRILGLGYITGAHKPTDRCTECGFMGGAK